MPGVATFPPVGDVERDDALHRIARRHQRYDDPRWSEAGTEARDVLDYLRRHRGRLPHQVTHDDAWDELVLSAWVYWDERRRERELLRHALTRGLSLREVGAFVGLHSRQGLRDHLDSLDARLDEYHRLTRGPRPRRTIAGGRDLLTGPPDDANTGGDAPRRSRNPYLRFHGRSRAERAADGRYIRNRRAAARARPARETWINDHRQHIATVLGELLTQADRLGFSAVETDEGGAAELGDYLPGITEDIPDDVDDATFSTVGARPGRATHPPHRHRPRRQPRHPPNHRRHRPAPRRLRCPLPHPQHYGVVGRPLPWPRWTTPDGRPASPAQVPRKPDPPTARADPNGLAIAQVDPESRLLNYRGTRRFRRTG